jgi:hypothetical protein
MFVMLSVSVSTPGKTLSSNITCILSDLILFNNCKIIDRADHWSLLLLKEKFLHLCIDL